MKGTDDDEVSLGQDEVMALEKLSRDQRTNLNDSVFNLMLSQIGMNKDSKIDENKAVSEADGTDSERNDNEGLPQNPNLEKEDGSVEALTRTDTRALNIVRAVSLCVITMLAVFAVTYVFRYTKHVEDETFETEFKELGEKIVESFLSETRAKLLMTKSVAEYMSDLLPQHGPSLSITSSQFQTFVKPLRITVEAREVTWSPLILTQTERILFEQRYNNSIPSSASSGPFPACYFCGNETTYTFTNTDDVVSVAGFGNSLTCGALYQAGQAGEISSHDCVFLSSVAKGVCQCTSEVPPTRTEVVAHGIFRLEDGNIAMDTSQPPLFPIGLLSATDTMQSSVMYNQLSDTYRSMTMTQMVAEKFPIFSRTFDRVGDYYQLFVNGNDKGLGLFIAYPIIEGNTVVGSITSEFGWHNYVPASGLPPKSNFVNLVIRPTCGQALPFSIVNNSLQFSLDEDSIGPYGHMVVSSTYENFDALIRLSSGLKRVGGAAVEDEGICRYKFEVYPTTELRNEFSSHRPRLYASFAAVLSGITIVLFTLYDCFVRRRQKKMLKAAKKTTALIANLFPKMVRNQIIEDTEKRANLGPLSEVGTKTTRRGSMFSSMTSLNYTQANASFLRDPKDDSSTSRPIATLFENTTVMFLDLAGFTAWSSEREPNEVFLLLETIYQSFDEAAARRGVFKIETIGDCYVAVTGVPDPMEEHALVMAKFAQECMKRMKRITKQLEAQLGPSTADLECRVGMHSGPVTGGVLRGEKARFQLFGDTMNTAARMESTGVAGAIQASSFTADLITQAGRQNWVIARPDLVTAKGKGQLQTYWINPGSKRVTSRMDLNDEEMKSEISSGDSAKVTEVVPFIKDMRLIEWTVDLLFSQLQKLVISRGASGTRPRTQRMSSLNNSISRISRGSQALLEEEAAIGKRGGSILDEYSAIIDLPKYDARSARKLSLNDDMQVELSVREQLREYVTRIASMYRDVPFHNFEHASHVAMAASKLLKRMMKHQVTQKHGSENMRLSHTNTYGISSDPLMQFTLIFAALIHDVDHTGLRNSDLVRMRSPAAVIYKNKSVAEQNSFSVAWTVLMDEDFAQLRECIYTTKDELRRFRQLLVNAIVASDFEDEEAQKSRHDRWEKAFEKESDDLERRGSSHQSKTRNDMRATILYEHIMQAADISHAIQHWQTFSKFHERMFSERFTAFMNGEETVDPSLTWYDDQLVFFDKTAIPLAEKLRSCDVFGSTGSEFVRWAEQNRNEWMTKGKSIVRHMRENVARQYEKIHAKERRRRGSII